MSRSKLLKDSLRPIAAISPIKLRKLSLASTFRYTLATSRVPCDQRYAASVNIWAAKPVLFFAHFVIRRERATKAQCNQLATKISCGPCGIAFALAFDEIKAIRESKDLGIFGLSNQSYMQEKNTVIPDIKKL